MQANERRAQAFGMDRQCMSIDPARSQSFAVEMRADTVMWTDPKGEVSERNRLEGYASVVNKKYEMYDMFGSYTEMVATNAFDVTLSKEPDVAFLVNHRGVTMARTKFGTLELSADKKGLKSVAYLNPKRSDVKDLIVAIGDKDITEMSFAFMIDDGSWNDDFTEYSINQVDLNRGDVSAVNYGANPYTSVSARQMDVIRDFRALPRGAQRAAILSAGLTDSDEHSELIEQATSITDTQTLYLEQRLIAELLTDI